MAQKHREEKLYLCLANKYLFATRVWHTEFGSESVPPKQKTRMKYYYYEAEMKCSIGKPTYVPTEKRMKQTHSSDGNPNPEEHQMTGDLTDLLDIRFHDSW